MKLDDINIVYEDNHLLVVVKPQNIPTCPDISNDENLLNLLKNYVKINENKLGNAYVGLVHRLDRPTGGVMVFAKTTKAARRLATSKDSNDFEKKYLAVVCGVPKEQKMVLQNSLYKDRKKNQVYCVPVATEGAKKAILEYSTLETRSQLSLVDINLLTGRTHQARVQLKNINVPIYGDAKYGKVVKGANLALWAYSLKFPHPVKDEIMSFIVYPPVEKAPWNLFDIGRHLSLIK